MNYYRQPAKITGKKGNNAFSYEERAQIKGTSPELVLPILQEVSDIEDILQGDGIVFEEAEDSQITSCTGLKALYQFAYTEKKVPVYVMDNHNHALYCWARERTKQGWTVPAELFHIDQHKDMRDPQVYLTLEEFDHLEKVAEYVNDVLNVGNFIVPTIHAGIVKKVEMMDHSQAFASIPKIDSTYPIIVDIDLDIFCKELEFYGFDQIIKVTKTLMLSADVITIATSPYFIDQVRALQFLHVLFEE